MDRFAPLNRTASGAAAARDGGPFQTAARKRGREHRGPGEEEEEEEEEAQLPHGGGTERYTFRDRALVTIKPAQPQARRDDRCVRTRVCPSLRLCPLPPATTEVPWPLAGPCAPSAGTTEAGTTTGSAPAGTAATAAAAAAGGAAAAARAPGVGLTTTRTCQTTPRTPGGQPW